MKKLLLITLGVVLTLPAFARDFTYQYKDQTLSYYVTDKAAKTVSVDRNEFISGVVEIPSKVYDGEDTYVVTEIGELAFVGCSGLTSVTIPNSVTSIGEDAFLDCNSLTSVTIPNSVTVIDKSAFAWCKHLKSIIVSERNKNYATINGVLYNKAITKLIQFPGGKTSVNIPNSVTEISESAFDGCESLTSVTIPNSVTVIGNYAFAWCSGLISVTIPNSVTVIDNYAFAWCSGLTSVTIPHSVIEIGERTFYNCSAMTSVTISNSVTQIGREAFLDCSSLTSVTIPNSVTVIGNRAFGGCSSLKSIIVNEGNKNFASINGVLYNKAITKLIQCPGAKTSVTIPNSVTKIGDFSFSGCYGLTSVTIPNSVTVIGDRAFSFCRSLTSLTIPNSVNEIGGSAFYDCHSLTAIYYNAHKPISACYSIFSEKVYNNATLYLPKEAIASAETVSPWRNFKNIVAYDF